MVQDPEGMCLDAPDSLLLDERLGSEKILIDPMVEGTSSMRQR